MGIMPHTSIDDAMELALSLDIPFWPQLPRTSFYQDMFAQTSQNFPGIAVDIKSHRLSFSTDRFYRELLGYSRKIEDNTAFALTGKYAGVYERFMHENLQGYHAVRGQIAGPISLGFNVLDESRRPIIYNDEVKAILFDFIQKKLNNQYRELRERNPNAFVWLDEPGLSYVFSGMYGYHDRQAKDDYVRLLGGIEGPKGLHLCPNVNLPYLLQLGIDILSFDAYQLGSMPTEYARAAAEFIRGGGIICWGITPTAATVLVGETPETLTSRLVDYWKVISQVSGLSLKEIAGQALVAPAKCSVKEMELFNAPGSAGRGKEPVLPPPDIEIKSVNRAFRYLKKISANLKDICGISE